MELCDNGFFDVSFECWHTFVMLAALIFLGPVMFGVAAAVGLARGVDQT